MTLRSGARPFLSTSISQVSVAMHLRGGGIFYYHFITNLLASLSVKELWKSVSICQNYCLKTTGFLWTQCILTFVCMYVILFSHMAAR